MPVAFTEGVRSQGCPRAYLSHFIKPVWPPNAFEFAIIDVYPYKYLQ